MIASTAYAATGSDSPGRGRERRRTDGRMIERLIWLVPIAVAGLGVWRPRAGLVALAAALPLFGSPPGGPYLAALEAAGLAAILTAWRGGRPTPSPLTWPVAAFVAVGVVSLVPLTYHPPSWQPSVLLRLLTVLPGVESWSAIYAWRALADLLLGWGLFAAVRRAFSGRSLLPLVWGLLAGLTVTAVVGLTAHFGVISLDAYRPAYHQHLPLSSRRLSSLFFLSGWLSQYLVYVAPVALAGLYSTKIGRRLLGPLLLALVLTCLLLTQQRGAWIAAVAQLAFLAVVSLRRGMRLQPRKLALPLVVTLALVVVVVFGSGDLSRELAERVRSLGLGLGDRAANWSGAAELIRERPVLGWGVGSFAPAYDLLHPVGSIEASRHRLTAHSLYFQIGTERGAVGLVSLGLLAWAAVICLRRLRPGREVLGLALTASLVGMTVYGLVQYPFYLRSVGWLLWMLIGCVSLVGRSERWVAGDRSGQALVLLALLLLPLRALGVQPPPFAGDRSFGFHQPERGTSGSFEWTGRTATRRLPWAGQTLVLTLANGHPLAGKRPVEVRVAVDGVTMGELSISGGWEEHRFEVGPPRDDWILLTLEATPAFRPFSDFPRYPNLHASVDIRSLGVAVKEIRWESATPVDDRRRSD